jgi:hypothetical protein
MSREKEDGWKEGKEGKRDEMQAEPAENRVGGGDVGMGWDGYCVLLQRVPTLVKHQVK